MDTESESFFKGPRRGHCLQHGEASYGEVDCGEGNVFGGIGIFNTEEYYTSGTASMAAGRTGYRC